MSVATPRPVTSLLFVIGASHQTAPIEIREKLALGPEQRDALSARLNGLSYLREHLILNTCNRTEIYGVSNQPAAAEDLRQLFLDFLGPDHSTFSACLFWKSNHQAVQHIFEVSSGIDSQIVGETEIFGQVKDSYAAALKRRTVGPVLNHVFQKSFKEAKWARTHTGITRGQISIGNIAVDLAIRIFGDLDRSRILILGTGEVAETTGLALLRRGEPLVTVSSRTFDKAADLARRLHASVIDFRDFRDRLDQFDILITSTSAPGFIISRADLQAAVRRRRHEPVFIIDLALPRDVDPAVQDLDSVFLYNLDDLSRIANENLEARLAEVKQVKETFARNAWSLWLSVFRRYGFPR